MRLKNWQGEARVRRGIVKDTLEYAQKTKEIREVEARISEEKRDLSYAENWRDECEATIAEWSAGVGFFARLRPPPEIRERKNRRNRHEPIFGRLPVFCPV